MGILREENASLKSDKRRLEAEVDELKECFKAQRIMLKGTEDKVHMPWLLSQLRDSVQLKEKVIELEEIIENSGWTVMVLEAEDDCRKKERELELEVEKITGVMETLKAQVEGVERWEVPVLVGKLEECLLVFGYEGIDT